jgi:transposase
VGAGLSLNEQVAAPGEPLPIGGSGGDRWAAHYYRALHARALQREQHWKAKALGYEQTIAQFWVLVGGLARQLEALKGQLAWLHKQLSGRKTEAGPAHGLAGAGPAATASSACGEVSEASDPGPEWGAAPAQAPAGRARGQQRGGPGPKRQRRWQLPEQVVEHRLSEAQRSCPLCGKLRPELGLTEQSEQIEWEVRWVRHRHVRHRYGPSCECALGRGIVTAPKPAKLIAKGLFGVSFSIQVLLKKFAWSPPLHRTVGELRAHGLTVSPGTLSGGLRQLKDLLAPLAGQFVLRSREGSHWHMDETRWPMFGLPQEKSRQQWWFWVVVTPEVTAFLLELTRSGQVPQQFFAPGAQGILRVDRYAGYAALQGADRGLRLAYCWSHQHRDFVSLGQGHPRWAKWAGQWVEQIDGLFASNGQRRQAYFQQQAPALAALESEVRRQVQELQQRLAQQLASAQLAPEQQKVLQSLRRHWPGLIVFVDHPAVPVCIGSSITPGS